jgi:hypothetical protein
MPDLKSYKIISLEASDWDKEKSDPKKGSYIFNKKVFVDKNLYKSAHRPKYKFGWNRNHPYDIADWQNKWAGCSFATAKDGYVVDKLAPDAEGHYVYKDAVLMKIPVGEYVEKRREEIAISEKAPTAALRAYRQECGALGIDVSLDEVKQAFGRT